MGEYNSPGSPRYTLEHTYSGISANPKRLTFSHCGNYLASAHADNCIELRSVNEQVLTKKIRSSYMRGLSDLVWRANHDQLITASLDHKLRVFDAATGVTFYTFFDQSSLPLCCAVHPMGDLIASGSIDGKIRIYDIRGGFKILYQFSHDCEVTSVNFSPGGNKLVSSSLDGSCSLWDMTQNQKMISFPNPPNKNQKMYRAMFLTNGSVITSQKNVVKIWNVHNGRSYARYTGHINESYCMYADFSVAESRWMFMGSETNRLFVWDVQNKKLSQVLKAHSNFPLCTAVHPFRSVIATSSIDDDKTIKIWRRKLKGRGTHYGEGYY